MYKVYKLWLILKVNQLHTKGRKYFGKEKVSKLCKMVKNIAKEKSSNIVQDISMQKCGIIIHNMGEDSPLSSPQDSPNIVK